MDVSGHELRDHGAGNGQRSRCLRLRRAGANAVIDYCNADVAEQTRNHAAGGVDAVIDLVNQFDALKASAALVRQGGQLLSTLFGPDPAQLAGAGIELTYVRNSPRRGDLERVAQLVVDGTVMPVPGQAVAFADSAAASKRLSSGAPAGKTVLDLAGQAAASPGAPSSPTTEISA